MKHALVALLVPVQLQLGHFTGVDQFGQACSLTVTAKSGDVMDSFVFETAGFSYEVVTGPRLKTAMPGHLSLKASLALTKSNGPNRMVYANSRAPGALETTFDILTRGGDPLSVKMTKASKDRQSVEACNRLIKSEN